MNHPTHYKALVITESPKGVFHRDIQQLQRDQLPPGEVLVRVLYSSLNYKDALSATGNKGITRNFPHTPGIDAAGIVLHSDHPAFASGEEVVVTGYDLGMNTPGGFGQLIRVPAHWLIKKPEGFTLKDCMVIGTAGITAGLALHKMELLGLNPVQGPIVVTGSTGGVGSIATALLHHAGYTVIAVSGKAEAGPYLKGLGAARVEKREWVDDQSGKVLIRPSWAGAVDTVGGNTLATLLKGCRSEGVIACTGLVGSPLLHTTVYPFILNGVSLTGIGSAETPLNLKKTIWEKFSGMWNIRDLFPQIAREVTLEELSSQYIPRILQGAVTGRVVVNLGD